MTTGGWCFRCKKTTTWTVVQTVSGIIGPLADNRETRTCACCGYVSERNILTTTVNPRNTRISWES
jgi:hypothetical protein